MTVKKFKTTLKTKEDFNRLKEYLQKINGVEECFLENDNPGGKLIIKSNDLPVDMLSREIFNAGYRNEPVKSGWEKITGGIFKKDCCK